MRTTISCSAAVGMMLAAAAVSAQTTPREQAVADQRRELQIAMQLKESRYQINQIERVLEGAVEHGATVIRDRLQAAMQSGLLFNVGPADMLLSENARARGFRLDGYGVFFDVQVPALEGTVPWVYRTLEQNDLALDSALRTLRTYVQAQAANDVNLQQALKRIELQMAPVSTPVVAVSDSRNGLASTPVTAAPGAVDPILKNPNDEYRTAIRDALVDAMLEHTRGLGIGADELLTVGARSSEDRPRLAPADPEGQTVLISVRGSDLRAFLAGEISRDDARKRVTVRVF